MPLTRFIPPPALRDSLLRGIAVATVSLAAFLSFSIQPIVGKALLPAQGGSSSTWLGTMLYFQAALLTGYGLASWLLSRRRLVQIGTFVGLAGLALVATRLNAVRSSEWTGIGGVFGTLAIALFPATTLLFCASPLLHGWLQSRRQTVPYHLYAFSNGGSLLAVALYPFTVERYMGLSDQMQVWQVLLAVLVLLVGIASFLFLRSPATSTEEAPEPEALAPGRILAWLALSGLTCIGMLGATHHLSAEIGASPVAWVGPFGLYLASFLIIFSGAWRPAFTLVCLAWLAVSLTGFMLTKGVSTSTVDGAAAFWLLSLSAAGSFFGNGLLYELRPRRRFAFFYLVNASGGVLGGLFVSLAASWIFLRPSEFLFVSVILLLCGLFNLLKSRDPLVVIVALVIVVSPVLGMVFVQTAAQSEGMLEVRRFRNIYGSMMLKTETNGLILSNETTTHGTQLTASPEARRRPTLYYTESSGLGRTIAKLQDDRAYLNVGIIGLGAGTIATYARPVDTVDFWDIDPQAVHVARDFFTFLADSPGKIHVIQADGRRGLAGTKTDYDLIVIDAFAGDAIPAHLVTREALAIYFRRLEKRGGILAIHTTNRYHRLFPVLAATAHTLGWSTLRVATDITATAEERDWDGVATEYLLMARTGIIDELTAILPDLEDEGRVARQVTRYQAAPPGQTVIWTDDRNATLDALQLGRFLSPR